jgi:hypothetical protein
MPAIHLPALPVHRDLQRSARSTEYVHRNKVASITPSASTSGTVGYNAGQINPTIAANLGQAATTVAAVPATVAPSSTIPVSISNVATALGVSPYAIINDTTGFWNSFYASLANQSIDAGSASAQVIQTAYDQYNGGLVAAATPTNSLLIGALVIGGIFLLWQK